MRSPISLLVLLLTIAPAATGQRPPGVGDRVRVTHSDEEGRAHRLIGTVVDWSGEALTVHESGVDIRIPRAELTTVEVSRGKGPAGARGVFLGFLVGAAAGGLVAYLADPDDNDSPPEIAGAFGAGLGGLSGAFLGAGWGVEKWGMAYAAPPTARLGPAPGGSVALSFRVPL